MWLGEAAQTLTCNVDFEIPAVKKASARAQQQLLDLQRRRKEFLHSATAAAAAYAQVRLGFCVMRHMHRQRDGRRGRPCSGVCLAAMRTASVSLLRESPQVSGKLVMCGRRKLEIQAGLRCKRFRKAAGSTGSARDSPLLQGLRSLGIAAETMVTSMRSKPSGFGRYCWTASN